MGLILRALLWVFIALIVNTVLRFYITLDMNKRQLNHAPGPCQLVSGINEGSEDIEVLPDGTAIISSGLRFINVSEVQDVVGKIFVYEFAKSDDERAKQPAATELKIISKTLDFKGFNPHGISTYTDEKGQVHLYVINHHPDGDRIERFLFDKVKKTLTHTKTIKHPLIYSGNDLVTTGFDKFYVTIDRYFKHGLPSKIEMYTMASLGSLVYFDGKNAKIVDQWLPFPNGIDADKSRKLLYVPLFWAKTLRVYDIQADNSITFKRDIKVQSSIDNVWVDRYTGDLWCGAHPVVHEGFKYLEHPKSLTAPSQVIRIVLAKKEGEEDYISEPYANDGSVLSASSSAARFKNQFLVGTISHKLLLCDILTPETI